MTVHALARELCRVLQVWSAALQDECTLQIVDTHYKKWYEMGSMNTEQIEAAVIAAVATFKFQLSDPQEPGRDLRYKITFRLPDENTEIQVRYPAPRDEDLAAPITKLREECVIAPSTLTFLTGADLHVVGDIARASRGYLLEIPGINLSIVSAIEDYLDRLNLDTSYSGPVGPLERAALLKIDRIEQYIKGVSCDLPPGTRTVGNLATATFEDFMRANPTAPEQVVSSDYNTIRERLQRRGLIE
jgi:hypothetical protein